VGVDAAARTFMLATKVDAMRLDVASLRGGRSKSRGNIECGRPCHTESIAKQVTHAPGSHWR